jgi:rhodanese-related sulfurtransferase
MLKTLLSNSVEQISIKEAAKTNAIFLDARTKAEYNVSHIEGSIWVGYENFQLDAIDQLPRDKQIIVYCSVGYRSEKIGEKLKSAGFINTYNLYGGIFEWVNTGKEIVNSSGEPTRQVHAYNKVWGVWLNKGQKVYK